METRLTLKQTQKLVMTTMLQQAIKLLPLSRLELVQYIRNELVENPLLMDEEDLENGETEILEGELEEKQEEEKAPIEIDWEPFIQDNVDYGLNLEDYSEAPPIENTIKKETTLFDYLLWQLSISTRDDKERDIGVLIVGNINDDGYLSYPVEEIAAEAKAEIRQVEKVLQLIQTFDPTGVGARDLRECLFIQAKNLGETDPLVEQIILNHMQNLDPKLLPKISRDLGVPSEELMRAIDFIRSLDPFPGRKYSGDSPQYITPDVTVVKVNDEYQVFLNEDDVPSLRINPYYHGLLHNYKERTNNPVRHYIEEKFRSAVWLMKSIEQRRQTLLKVALSIVKFQREFLDKGLNYIRPLVLRDVAEDIEMHESTVSRVTTSKYMHTPQGLFGMKYFFHSGLNSTFGDTLSSLKVKDMIKRLVSDENHDSPLTDQEIVEYLRRQKINIARRTVSKYRQELNISPSSKRRKFIPLSFNR